MEPCLQVKCVDFSVPALLKNRSVMTIPILADWGMMTASVDTRSHSRDRSRDPVPSPDCNWKWETSLCKGLGLVLNPKSWTHAGHRNTQILCTLHCPGNWLSSKSKVPSLARFGSRLPEASRVCLDVWTKSSLTIATWLCWSWSLTNLLLPVCPRSIHKRRPGLHWVRTWRPVLLYEQNTYAARRGCVMHFITCALLFVFRLMFWLIISQNSTLVVWCNEATFHLRDRREAQRCSDDLSDINFRLLK